MNCIVIDDDKVAQKVIQFLIAQTSALNIIGIFNSVTEALPIINTKQVDLIFLDIEMPEISGIDFIKNFGDLPQIIICSSRREYAADSYEFNVADYLIKPISYQRFLKAIEKVKSTRDDFKPNLIKDDSYFIKNKGSYVNVNSKDILYFEALSDYINIYTTTNRYTISSTMRSIESKLPSTEFIRVHRSFIVRIDKVTILEEGHLFIRDKSIPISKSYKKELMKVLSFL